MNIGIVGLGETGKSLAEIYADHPQYRIFSKDLDFDEIQEVEILNICIPYNEKFLPTVTEKASSSDKIIIHSTVPVGVTRKVFEATGISVCHSPIRGIHPHLYEGLKTFVKYVGPVNHGDAPIFKAHLESLGMKSEVFSSPETTELAKLLSTTYYGICIAWHGEMGKMCQEHGLDFTEVVSEFNKTYNQGYTELGKLNVVRPELYAPEKHIGGHCVIPNAKILFDLFPSTLVEGVLEYALPEDAIPETLGD